MPCADLELAEAAPLDWCTSTSSSCPGPFATLSCSMMQCSSMKLRVWGMSRISVINIANARSSRLHADGTMQFQRRPTKQLAWYAPVW